MAIQMITYPVLLHAEAAGGYSVEIPDIAGGTWTQGETVTEALQMAQDVIGTMLADEVQIPVATPFEALTTDDTTAKAIVSFDLQAFRRRHTQATQVNVSIPAYLRDAGRQAGLNLSQVLTEALHQQLGI